MESNFSLVISTCADKDAAKRIARRLLDGRLAACVQILPMESVYRWQGELCEGSETILFIKTKTMLFESITAAIREIHSYEVPEIIQIPITDGLPAYLQWVDDATGPRA